MDFNINFPNLHIHLENVGKNIMIGDFAIAYYGIVIGLAMIAGVLLATHIAKVSGQNPDDYYDLAIYAIIFAVIGIIVAVAAAAYGIYRFFTPDYLDDFEDDFEDGFEDDFFEDEEDDVPAEKTVSEEKKDTTTEE